jgi:hypothetical protein
MEMIKGSGLPREDGVKVVMGLVGYVGVVLSSEWWGKLYLQLCGPTLGAECLIFHLDSLFLFVL